MQAIQTPIRIRQPALTVASSVYPPRAIRPSRSSRKPFSRATAPPGRFLSFLHTPSEPTTSSQSLPLSASELAISSTTHGPAHASTAAKVTNPSVQQLFEPETGSWQYVVADPITHSAVILDPVLNFASATGKVSTESADALLKIVAENGYKVDMILETHAHADHVTAASYLQRRLAKTQERRPLIGIGKRITEVQRLFGERYGIPIEAYQGAFDKLWEDDEIFHVGLLEAQAIHLPGHTPDHMGYKVGDNVFVGDSVFNVDLGSARADFPGGSAEAIFSSGRKLFALPDHTKIWVGHDYPPPGRNLPVPYMTVKQQREENKHLKNGILEQAFVEMRRQRDGALGEPRLLHLSLQMNIRAGKLPEPTPFGRRMVQIPLDLQNQEW